MWINPVLLQIGPLEIHWYGLMYALSFITGFLLLQYSSLGRTLSLNSKQKDNFLIYVILGIILGGRIGYILFYNLFFYLENPLNMLYVWEGGMSFHGGVLGVLTALLIFTKRHKINFWLLADFTTIVAPIGIFFGRIGNFINGELYGRVAENFCLYFPTDPNNCRYPSQLVEAALEGVILFLLLLLIRSRQPKPGIISASFLVLYGILRTIAEIFREPDPQIGFYLGFITQGQILSMLMIIVGLVLIPIFLKKTSK